MRVKNLLWSVGSREAYGCIYQSMEALLEINGQKGEQAGSRRGILARYGMALAWPFGSSCSPASSRTDAVGNFKGKKRWSKKEGKVVTVRR